MRQFFKFVFASMVGCILSGIILFIIFQVMIFRFISKINEDEAVKANPNSILRLKFDYDIKERTASNPLGDINFTSFEYKSTPGLNDILTNIRKAKIDDNIKGIFLEFTYQPIKMGTAEEIRKALIDFKKSGKFVVAYGEVISQKAYYLASAADKIYLNPNGIVEFTGFSTQIPFFKNTLEKLEIKAQVFYNGKFKSATEPFRLDRMSEANKEQTTSLLTEVYNRFLSDISTQRKISIRALDSIANNLLLRKAADAKALGLVDEVFYIDEVEEALKKRVGIDNKRELEFIALSKYMKTENLNKTKYKSSKIAILYADGNIVDGEGKNDEIASADYVKAIKELRDDKNVKAIVLRVNSPGGSALASDIIWRELSLTKKVKPIIVSMGDVAASGGYYIACIGDSVLAEANTITGSIGVFALVPNLQGFFNNKLGVTFDGVKTATYADIATAPLSRPFNEAESAFIQSSVDHIYEVFISRVAAGRKKDAAYIDSIAQGRVWTGTQAREIGLVDRIGNIEDALRIASKKAGLEEYRIVEYPKKKDFLTQLLSDMNTQATTSVLEKELGQYYPFFKILRDVKHYNRVQALLPYEFNY